MSIALDQFLRSVQNRAYVQAVHAVGNRDEALDIVQDSMFKLARKYSTREPAEWPLLFQRVLQNQIRDWYRRQKVRSVLFWWEQYPSDAGVGPEHHASSTPTPEATLTEDQALTAVGTAIRALPARQQQVFLLRALWEHSVEETATILGCRAATVKTHYQRAVQRLRATQERTSC